MNQKESLCAITKRLEAFSSQFFCLLRFRPDDVVRILSQLLLILSNGGMNNLELPGISSFKGIVKIL